MAGPSVCLLCSENVENVGIHLTTEHEEVVQSTYECFYSQQLEKDVRSVWIEKSLWLFELLRVGESDEEEGTAIEVDEQQNKHEYNELLNLPPAPSAVESAFPLVDEDVPHTLQPVHSPPFGVLTADDVLSCFDAIDKLASEIDSESSSSISPIMPLSPDVMESYSSPKSSISSNPPVDRTERSTAVWRLCAELIGKPEDAVIPFESPAFSDDVISTATVSEYVADAMTTVLDKMNTTRGKIEEESIGGGLITLEDDDDLDLSGETVEYTNSSFECESFPLTNYLCISSSNVNELYESSNVSVIIDEESFESPASRSSEAASFSESSVTKQESTVATDFPIVSATQAVKAVSAMETSFVIKSLSQATNQGTASSSTCVESLQQAKSEEIGSDLNQEIQKDKDSIFCQECCKDVLFIDQQRHLYEVHVDRPLFHCSFCDFSAPIELTVAEHLTTSHALVNNNLDISCEVDDFLEDIERWRARCFISDKESPATPSLSTMQSTPSQIRPVGRSPFSTRPSIVRRLKFDSPIPPVTPSPEPQERKKSSSCQLCGKKVINKRVHVFWHLDQADMYHCRLCDVKSAWLKNNVVHHATKVHRDVSAVVSREAEFAKQFARWQQRCYGRGPSCSSARSDRSQRGCGWRQRMLGRPRSAGRSNEDGRPRRQYRKRSRGNNGNTSEKPESVEGVGSSANTPEIYSRLFDVLVDWKADDGHELSGPFISLPSRKQLPDYYRLIAHPMDFEKIKRRIRKGRYETLSDMEADFNLLCSNAQAYNEDGSKIYNEDGSKIYNDSVLLQSVWETAKKLALMPLELAYDVSDYPVPLRIGRSSSPNQCQINGLSVTSGPTTSCEVSPTVSEHAMSAASPPSRLRSPSIATVQSPTSEQSFTNEMDGMMSAGSLEETITDSDVVAMPGSTVNPAAESAVPVAVAEVQDDSGIKGALLYSDSVNRQNPRTSIDPLLEARPCSSRASRTDERKESPELPRSQEKVKIYKSIFSFEGFILPPVLERMDCQRQTKRKSQRTHHSCSGSSSFSSLVTKRPRCTLDSSQQKG